MSFREINLKEGMPYVDEALARLKTEIYSAKSGGESAVKFIHGYGSSGKGGKIKRAVHEKLAHYKVAGVVEEYVPGEEFTPFSGACRNLLIACPEAAHDRDYSRYNHGVTIVLLRRKGKLL